MKISKDLMQFNNGAALLIVSGKEDAKFFIAQNGIITRVDSFRVNKLDYSDREQFMKRTMPGKGNKVVVAGSEYEMKDPTLVHDFLMQVLGEFNKIKTNFDISKIYLFCAPYMKAKIKKTIPNDYRNKVVMTVEGDYHFIHPFDLIKIIQKKLESKKIKLIKPEAKKILESGSF